MKTLTTPDLQELLQSRQFPSSLVAKEARDGLIFEYPAEGARYRAFCGTLLPFIMWQPFPGALLMLTGVAIFGEDDPLEAMNLYLERQLRISEGVLESIRDAPSILFDESELTAAQTHLLICLIGLWDAIVISKAGDYFAELSHDGYVTLGGSNSEMVGSVAEYLPSLGCKKLGRVNTMSICMS